MEPTLRSRTDVQKFCRAIRTRCARGAASKLRPGRNHPKWHCVQRRNSYTNRGSAGRQRPRALEKNPAQRKPARRLKRRLTRINEKSGDKKQSAITRALKTHISRKSCCWTVFASRQTLRRSCNAPIAVTVRQSPAEVTPRPRLTQPDAWNAVGLVVGTVWRFIEYLDTSVNEGRRRIFRRPGARHHPKNIKLRTSRGCYSTPRLPVLRRTWIQPAKNRYANTMCS